MRTEINRSEVSIGEPGFMRVGPFVELPSVLQSLGVNPTEVFTELELGAETFCDPSQLIQFTTLGRLLLHCSRRTDCDHFGLLVGRRARHEHFGLVGELMRNAPTLEAAIMDWSENQHRFVRGSVINVMKRNYDLIMTYRIHQSRVPGIAQIVDTAAAAGFAVLHNLTKQSPVEVWLPRKKPRMPGAYRDTFGVIPRYDVSVAALVFSHQATMQRISGARAAKRKRLISLVRKYRTMGFPTFPDQVRRLLGAKITTSTASKAEIAHQLGVHERVMSRRLLEAGTTFRDLVNETRFEVACQLLTNTELTAEKIAEALQYNDASAFVKAFQRCAGLSPLMWRKQSRKS